jgi:hypothetical protein
MTGFSAMQGEVIRVTEMDASGVPTGRVGVSKSYTRVQSATSSESASTTTTKNAGGEVCMTDTTPEVILGSDLTIDFCKIDPALFDLMSSARATVDCDGAIAGTAQGTTGAVGSFALEIWAKKGPDGSTKASGDGWYYTVFPSVKKGALGGTLEWSDNPQTYTLTASAAPSSSWNTGLYGVLGAAGAPVGVIATPSAPTYAPGGDVSLLCDAVRNDEFVYSIKTMVQPPADAQVTTGGATGFGLATMEVSDSAIGFDAALLTFAALQADPNNGDISATHAPGGPSNKYVFKADEAILLIDGSLAWFDPGTKASAGTPHRHGGWINVGAPSTLPVTSLKMEDRTLEVLGTLATGSGFTNLAAIQSDLVHGPTGTGLPHIDPASPGGTGPLAAFGTAEYVGIGTNNGTKVNWDGAAWVAGAHA